MLRSRHGVLPGHRPAAVRRAARAGRHRRGVRSRRPHAPMSRARATTAGPGPCRGRCIDKSRDDRPTSDFLKPQVLRDGSLIALGYRFHRDDPEQPIAIQETDGALPGDDIVAFSTRRRPDVDAAAGHPAEHAGAARDPVAVGSSCASGDIVATGGLFKMPDGTNPSGQFGPLLRSTDGGQTWDDRTRYFDTPGPLGRRLRVARLRDAARPAGRDLLGVRHRGRAVPAQPGDGVARRRAHLVGADRHGASQAESANLLYLGGERLLSIHCHRGSDVGLFVRLVDFTRRSLDAARGTADLGRLDARSRRTTARRSTSSRGRSGSARARCCDSRNGDILATHWCVVDGQGKVLTHRLRVS